MSAPLVRLSDLRFGPEARPIVAGINLTLEAGHFLGIVGPNGAGKSTLLNLIAGLSQPDAGAIELFGERLGRQNRLRLLRQVGFLHQLHESQQRLPLRVRDVVAMGLVDYALPWRRAGRQPVISEALEMVEMQSLADADYRLLSGGQQQRVRLARVLARRPELLLLDEPSAALDSVRQEGLFKLLRRLCDETGMGVIMVEHDIAAISSHVDSVACLNRHIHHRAMRGEEIPEEVWRSMYGDHIHIVAHDASCIGCTPSHDHD